MLTFPTAAMRIRRELAVAEKASDELLLKLTALQGTMIAARIDTEVAVHTGQEALLRLQKAMSKAIAAQTDLLRAHDSIAKVGREVMGGDEIYCPPSGGLGDDELTPQILEIAA